MTKRNLTGKKVKVAYGIGEATVEADFGGNNVLIRTRVGAVWVRRKDVKEITAKQKSS